MGKPGVTEARATPKPSRRKDVSTTRSTSGAGYDFEDQVAAWILSKAVVGDPVPGMGGEARRVQFQTAAAGWALDDLLVEVLKEEQPRRLSISCKASVQVTASGLPDDFVSAVWRQWRSTNGPYDQLTDEMALVTQIVHPTFQARWRDLKTWCEDDAPDSQAIIRIEASRPHLIMFDKIRGAADAAETVSLIRHLHVIPLDLQLSASMARDGAVGSLRRGLADGRLTEAEALWTTLNAAAKAARLGGGTIRLLDLWAQLRRSFVLADHPDYRPGWAALRTLSDDHTARIETHLASGWSLPRVEARKALAESLAGSAVVLVHGESGAGKSALVQTVLEAQFVGARQVWLGPDALSRALGDNSRSSIPLARPLAETLAATATADTILILDSTEKLDPELLPAVGRLIGDLQPASADRTDVRIVILSGSDGLDARLGRLATAGPLKIHTVEPLGEDEVRAALRSRTELAWVAEHPATVSALTNLKTLAWICQAGASVLQPASRLVSLPTIADRLWTLWTGGSAAVQGMVMRLAIREAAFERSFPVSGLPPPDVVLFEQAAASLPLRVARNRLRFDHDLAADWARFQHLKEIADDVEAWSVHAANPLWTPALRLLGQYLLREPSGAGVGTAWDVAFAALPAEGLGLVARDILLDALYLDPQADLILESHRDLLFAQSGACLARMLRRFHHNATAVAPLAALNLKPGLQLYFDAAFRRPLLGRWRSIVPFLARHEPTIAGQMSSTVARLCETWLSQTPERYADGSPFAWRRELASLALATGRAVQVAVASGGHMMGEPVRDIFKAVLRGASDLPDEVAGWALEMARRRPLEAETAKRVEANKAAAVKEAELRRQAAPPRGLSSGGGAGWWRPNPLPAWPLGPSGRVHDDFRHVMIHELAAHRLYAVRPDDAVEILLACLVDEAPTDEIGASRLDRDLGLQADGGAYPTLFWKSPFYTLLAVSTEPAMSALVRLIDFCTERWAADVGDEDVAGVSLVMADGEPQHYVGDAEPFGWGQDESLDAGQLHCALDALEHWLCNRIEQGQDVSETVSTLLTSTRSTAVIGVLVNVGKYSPDLLKGPLRALFTDIQVVHWDRARVEATDQRARLTGFTQQAEPGGEVARKWTQAQHRRTTLQDVAHGWLTRDAEPPIWLAAISRIWPVPEGGKFAIEHRGLLATLDAENYRESGPDGARLFRLPSDVETDIATFNAKGQPKADHLGFTLMVRAWLHAGTNFDAAQAARMVRYMRETPTDLDCSPDDRRPNTVAAAAALVVLASDWLRGEPGVAAEAEAILREEIEALDATVGATRDLGHLPSGLDILARAVVGRWVQGHAGWDRPMVTLLTSGDMRAVAVVIDTAHQGRTALGSRWWRLLQVGLWSSALFLLRPRREDDPRAAHRWARRLVRLRRCDLSVPTTVADIDFADIQGRLTRLLNTIANRPLPEENLWRGDRSSGLWMRDQLFGATFGWLVEGPTLPPDPSPEERDLLLRLFRHLQPRLARLSGPHQDSTAPNRFEYRVIARLASLSLRPGEATAYWQPVLAMGPSAKIVVSQFLQGVFLGASASRSADFVRLWRALLDFVANSPVWREGAQWHQRDRLWRQLLGLESPGAFVDLDGLDQHMAAMKPYYARWAATHLTPDDDNAAALCSFLRTRVGKALRLDGLQWLARAFRGEPEPIYWRRESPLGPTAVEFVDVLLEEDTAALKGSQPAREAVVAICAVLLARNIPAALALQDKIALKL